MEKEMVIISCTCGYHTAVETRYADEQSQGFGQKLADLQDRHIRCGSSSVSYETKMVEVKENAPNFRAEALSRFSTAEDMRLEWKLVREVQNAHHGFFRPRDIADRLHVTYLVACKKITAWKAAGVVEDVPSPHYYDGGAIAHGYMYRVVE